MDEVVRQVLEQQHRLKIGRRIGRGGFAEVYEAESAEGVPCAVKVALDSVEEDNPAAKKELENLRLVQTITGHPHVVTLMDAWLVCGYLVTRWELATEGSLLDALKQYQGEGHAGIPVRGLLRYVHEAAQGIDFLNQRGIYHRAIKPGNLLLFHGHVKLADLGLAKFGGASTASHTGSGTLGYLPPEAYDQHRLSTTVDLYSLAATYVKLRTGREPFGDNPTEVVQRQMAGDPIVEGLRPVEAELVRAALAVKPEDRPQDGTQRWVIQLYRGLRGEGIETISAGDGIPKTEIGGPARPEPPTPRPRPSQRGAAVRVDPAGGGDVATLEEAVARVGRGGVIQLSQGTHMLRGPLEINRPVSILGEGVDATRVVCAGAGFVLRFAAEGRFTARGVCFEHVGSVPANVVEVDAADALVEQCSFQGGRQTMR